MMLYAPFPLIKYSKWHVTFRIFVVVDLLTQPKGGECVFGQNMCLHGALCSIPINLVYNMTTLKNV